MIKIIFVLGIILHTTMARSSFIVSKSFPIQTSSHTNTGAFESSDTFSEKSTSTGEKLIREKRFLNNLVESGFGSLRSGNWQECGRTRWGATIYTNGIGTACFGNCPERVRCGYRNDETYRDFRFGYQGRYDFGRINFG